jgi:quercetin dioxygenase-like cupin family protein
MTFVIHSEEAEYLGAEGYPAAVRLLTDASDTDGAVSAQRVTLESGTEGAAPHLHKESSELFFVIGGSAQILAGSDVTTLHAGDLAVVSPNMAHAFAAAPGASADLLIVITPGVERFEYFRLLARIAAGQPSMDDLLAAQDRYDNYFLDSQVWQAARG